MTDKPEIKPNLIEKAYQIVFNATQPSITEQAFLIIKCFSEEEAREQTKRFCESRGLILNKIIEVNDVTEEVAEQFTPNQRTLN